MRAGFIFGVYTVTLGDDLAVGYPMAQDVSRNEAGGPVRAPSILLTPARKP
jgi:hypothetical protein